jgi:hypothetical protein
MPIKKQVGRVITKATSLPFKASNKEENLVISIDVNVTTRSLPDEETKYFTTLDSSLLMLYRTIRLYNNIRKVNFTLNTIASRVYISTLKARTF